MLRKRKHCQSVDWKFGTEAMLAKCNSALLRRTATKTQYLHP